MSKRKIWFLVMALIVTAIAVAADSFCPGALNEVNKGLLVVMWIVMGCCAAGR